MLSTNFHNKHQLKCVLYCLLHHLLVNPHNWSFLVVFSPALKMDKHDFWHLLTKTIKMRSNAIDSQRIEQRIWSLDPTSFLYHFRTNFTSNSTLPDNLDRHTWVIPIKQKTPFSSNTWVNGKIKKAIPNTWPIPKPLGDCTDITYFYLKGEMHHHKESSIQKW